MGRVAVYCKPRPGTLGPRLRAELVEHVGKRPPIEGPVVLRLRFVWKTNGGPPAIPGPSIAALTRAVLDELPGVVYREEAQIVALHVGKELGNVDAVLVSW